MSTVPLVLTGAGGFARETAELVAAINDRAPTWDLLGYLDDDASKHGRIIDGLPVLGAVDWLLDHQVATAICVGNPQNYTPRARIVDRLQLPDSRFATLVHPTAVIPRSVTIGAGSVIHAMCVATGHSTIGAHVAAMPATVFTHDDIIGDFVTIGAGVRFAGSVRVGTGAYIGSGALIREGCAIGDWSLIGMGSVVIRDVPADQVWAGVPATYRREAGQQFGRPTTDHSSSPTSTSRGTS
jgi:sugar O-acyltransferase (sialic acid O-acetyltransferase NeuD family)